MTNEKVLVFPEEVLATIPVVNGFSSAAKLFAHKILAWSSLSFLEREKAEEDPRFKQVIPYIVFRHQGKVLRYTRTKAGGDSRLHSKDSIGIGGHVNDGDGPTPYVAYMGGIRREIDEEIVAKIDFNTVQLIGCVYDPSTPIGSVHFGMVYIAEVINPEVSSKDPAISDLRWMSREELYDSYESLEDWSKHIVDSWRRW